MPLFREAVPSAWCDWALQHLPQILVDHAHLERKAATTAINLQKYPALYPRLEEINAIAIEELQHFQLVVALLKRRGIPFTQPYPSHWISGLMRAVRNGGPFQAIDHLICCSLIEGRSCEKFQLLTDGLREKDPELSAFYGSLLASEGNHYATYLLMARAIDTTEANRRLEELLDLEAELARQPTKHAVLH